ncbi:prealbumin-like fold domain-containing protein [Bifidobacterium moraviense]|nr:prealbumin-like fold domain-containing protein [Bifidobacterium sp. DSM 109958]
MFQNIVTTYGDGSQGGAIIHQETGGTIVINGGTFQNNKGTRGTVLYVYDGDISKVEIHGGQFLNNKSNMAGGVIMQNAAKGTMIIDAQSGNIPLFSGNASGNAGNSKGGAIHNNGKLTVSAGTFQNNTAYGIGGGAISQDGGSTTIVPADGQTVTFQGNAHNVRDADGNPAQCNTTSGEADACWGNNWKAGGGAIYVTAGQLNVQGKVTFNGNYTRTWGYMDGGGAIYVKGVFWLQNDAKGNKPLFENNYAGVEQRETNTADGTVKTAFRGSAGGAIFLQEGSVDNKKTDETQKYSSRAYIMGGEFRNNTSGYLGGAVYTEAGTLTYIAKAVATGNVAGHFGGGLWLCPSGTGTASKGGNIALFDNKVDKSIDLNNEANRSPYPNDKPFTGDALVSWDNGGSDKQYGTVNGTGTEAGDDFAIMNPMWKGEIGSTNFQLMNTWFTDRTKTVVDWYYDGTPLKSASGFQDYFQDPEIQSKGGWHGHYTNPEGNDGGGTNLAVTMTGDRFSETGSSNEKIPDDEYTDHVRTLNLTRKASSDNKGVFTTGIALKAQKADGMSDEEWAAAKDGALNSASVVLTGNAARLSGGAFATNGDVKFSTPYTASWSKVDNNTTNPAPLAGSEWTLSTTGTGVSEDAARKNTELGGPFNTDFYPTICPTDKDGNLVGTGYADGACWEETVETKDGTTTVTRTAIVKDNIANDSNAGNDYAYAGFDNNPVGGGFDINNLANGTYTLTERKAPTGYQLDSTQHTFKVNNAQAKWNNAQGRSTENVDIDIVNTPLPGVSWSKVDADNSGVLVGGSEWTVTKLDDQGRPIDHTARTVTDCVDPSNDTKATPCADGTSTTKTYADTNGAVGVFSIKLDEVGTYQLKEIVVPDGYWHPEASTTYQFTITSTDKADAKVAVYPTDGSSNPLPSNNIPNKRTQVAWSKVAADNPDGDPLSGAEWEISGPYDSAGKTISGVKPVTAKVTDCTSEPNAHDPCGSHQNSLDSANGATPTYADLDPAAGKFKVAGFALPSDANTHYYYHLTETEAPTGYIKTDTVYEFVIDSTAPTGTLKFVKICPADSSATTSSSVTFASLFASGTNANTTECGDDSDTSANLILNYKAVAALPLTGGPGTARDWMTVGGAFVAAAGIVAALLDARRRRMAAIAGDAGTGAMVFTSAPTWPSGGPSFANGSHARPMHGSGLGTSMGRTPKGRHAI